MRKTDIVNDIANETGLPKVDIAMVFESLLTEIKRELVKGESIQIRGFGTFFLKKRAAKVGRNIQKNTSIAIPEHLVPSFKPGKEFKKLVNDTLGGKK